MIHHDTITAFGAPSDGDEGRFDIIEEDGIYRVCGCGKNIIAANIDHAYSVAFAAADEWIIENGSK